MSWKLRAAVSALLLAPQAAFALGLGDIRLNSALNEPLSAEIELVAPTAEELGALSAQLASRELFQRYGLDRAGYLDAMQFSVGRSSDGRNVLRVSSAAPITEPFVTFLVEVNWPRGRLLREYTLLLDPPVFAPKEAAPPAPVAAPRATAPAPRPAPVPVPAPAASTEPRPAPVAATPAAGESSYRVQPGDTLYDVAARFSGGGPSRTNRMMIAMFRENPAAFGGNINVLLSGAILRIPEPGSVDAISASEAAGEIGRQTSSWRSGEPAAAEPERLRLVMPSEPVEQGAAAEPVATDPAARIDQLNREIDESRRLLELKNAELARLREQVAAEAAAAAAAPVEPEEILAGEGEQPQEPPAETPAEAPAEAPPAPEAVAAAEAEAPSFVDRLSDNWQYVLGAAVLLLGGGLAYGYVRRRREEEFEEAIRGFEPPASAPVPTQVNRLHAPTGAAVAAGTVTGTSVEEQELEDFHTATMPPSGKTAADFGVSFQETFSSEAPLDLDKSDPLAEADFHMAYGLYDQAVDIVRMALEKEPGRKDYALKLLEIHFVAGEKAKFLEAARNFADTRGPEDAPDWDRVVIMGKQLAPDAPLFAGAAAGALVDLNLEGGDSRVDIDLLGPPEGEAGLDLDLGDGLGGGDASTQTEHTAQTEILDFDFDSVDQALSAGSNDRTVEMLHGFDVTAEMPQGLDRTAEMPQGLDRTAEMPQGIDSTAELVRGLDSTAEMPAVDEDEAPTLDSTKIQAALSPDSTAEMAMDDLGIDLGDLDALADAAPEDDVTQLLPVEDMTRLMPGAEPAVDFDIGGETPDLDLDVGKVLADDSADFGATEQIALDELPQISENEAVTMSEVGTKLDLARAYVDMGDPDGARSILEEVLKEGSASQKQEAQRLLDSLA